MYLYLVLNIKALKYNDKNILNKTYAEIIEKFGEPNEIVYTIDNDVYFIDYKVKGKRYTIFGSTPEEFCYIYFDTDGNVENYEITFRKGG